MITRYAGPKNAMPQMPLFGSLSKQVGECNYFFALVPSLEVQQQLRNVADELNASQKINGSWVSSERYHLTLHHLGQVLKDRPGLVERAIVAANKIDAKRFDIVLDDFACTDGKNGRFAGMLRLQNESLELKRFWQLLKNNLLAVKLGVELSDSFSPHITLLYNRQRLTEVLAFTPVSWNITDFVLVESPVGKSEHIEIGRWALTA